MKNAEEAYKREQKENEKKRMDEYAKRAGNNANHDNRLKTGKDTSVGVSYPPGVNFKKTW